jgi:hypothetical protein
MLDYLQRPKPEGRDDSFSSAPAIEPLHIRLAKKKGKVVESPSKNKSSLTSLS